jgi:hypothetical protein
LNWPLKISYKNRLDEEFIISEYNNIPLTSIDGSGYLYVKITNTSNQYITHLDIHNTQDLSLPHIESAILPFGKIPLESDFTEGLDRFVEEIPPLQSIMYVVRCINESTFNYEIFEYFNLAIDFKLSYFSIIDLESYINFNVEKDSTTIADIIYDKNYLLSMSNIADGLGYANFINPEQYLSYEFEDTVNAVTFIFKGFFTNTISYRLLLDSAELSFGVLEDGRIFLRLYDENSTTEGYFLTKGKLIDLNSLFVIALSISLNSLPLIFVNGTHFEIDMDSDNYPLEYPIFEGEQEILITHDAITIGGNDNVSGKCMLSDIFVYNKVKSFQFLRNMSNVIQ